MPRLAAFAVVLAVGSALSADEPTRAGPDWWALQPVQRVEPPAVKNAAWVRNPVDAFVLASSKPRGLVPAPEADRPTLVRRVTFDLTGLPPTPAEIDAFVDDTSPDAYERLVDRLLASPRYGERWAPALARRWSASPRARASSTTASATTPGATATTSSGVQRRQALRPHSSASRSPATLLGPATAGRRRRHGLPRRRARGTRPATARSARSSRPRPARTSWRTCSRAVGQTFLGLTVNCARCHDHKFDPIPQPDYYRLKAVVRRAFAGNRPLVSATQEAERRKKADALRQGRSPRLRPRSAAIETKGRDGAAQAACRQPEAEGLPLPLARGRSRGTPRDRPAAARRAARRRGRRFDGRLALDGKGAFCRPAAAAGRPRAAKTLEAWVVLPDLQAARRRRRLARDERRPARSTPSSSASGSRPSGSPAATATRRTRDLDAPAEDAKPGESIHVAVVYRGRRPGRRLPQRRAIRRRLRPGRAKPATYRAADGRGCCSACGTPAAATASSPARSRRPAFTTGR